MLYRYSWQARVSGFPECLFLHTTDEAFTPLSFSGRLVGVCLTESETSPRMIYKRHSSLFSASSVAENRPPNVTKSVTEYQI